MIGKAWQQIGVSEQVVWTSHISHTQETKRALEEEVAQGYNTQSLPMVVCFLQQILFPECL